MCCAKRVKLLATTIKTRSRRGQGRLTDHFRLGVRNGLRARVLTMKDTNREAPSKFERLTMDLTLSDAVR